METIVITEAMSLLSGVRLSGGVDSDGGRGARRGGAALCDRCLSLGVHDGFGVSGRV